MNLELLELAIAPHSSGTRQWRASRPFRLISGSFAMSPFATAAFALDPHEAITQFVWDPGNLDPAISIMSGAERYLFTWICRRDYAGGEIVKRGSESG